MDPAEVLRYAVERRASDVHVKAGNVPFIRVDGELLPTPFPEVTPEEAQRFADALMPPHKAEEFAETTIAMFDRLYAEGEEQGRVMCIPVHPFILGQPHRIRHLDHVLKHIAAHDRVWMATGGEIADWYIANYLPRLDRHLAELTA